MSENRDITPTMNHTVRLMLNATLPRFREDKLAFVPPNQYELYLL